MLFKTTVILILCFIKIVFADYIPDLDRVMWENRQRKNINRKKFTDIVRPENFDDLNATLNALSEEGSPVLRNKKFVMSLIAQHPNSFKYISLDLKNDKEVVMQAVSLDGSLLEFASDQMKDDPEVVIKAFQSDDFALLHASERLKKDKMFLLTVTKELTDVFSKPFTEE